MANPADQIAAIFRDALAKAIGDNESTYEKAATDAAVAGDNALRQGLFSGGFSIDDLLLMIPGVGELLTLPGSAIGGLLGKAGEFIVGVGSGWALGEFFSKVLEPVWQPIIHKANAELTNAIFDADTAAQLFVQGLMEQGNADSEGSGTGFDAAHMDHLAGLHTNHPAAEVLFELRRRGVVDDSFVTTTLKRLGYSDQAIGYLPALAANLLSPADLALAYLRTDIPQDEMYAYGAKLGVSHADMDILIGNTGEPLGLQELLEAYRRGFINQDTLERGIRQSRVRNEWIPTAEALRYAPMGTADAVRAVVENYINTDEGQAIAEQNGLTPDHWPILVESWGRPLAHMEMASLVHRGLADRTQFDQAMRESDVKDKYIDLSFEIATPLLPERLIVSAIRYNAIDLTQGSEMLLARGYSADSVKVLLKLGLAEAAGSTHELTRAEITSLYQEGGLSRAEATTHLEAIGFSAGVADEVLQVVDLKQHAAEVRAEVSAIRTSYLAGGIDDMQATTELKNLGLTDAVAANDVETWKREKRRAAKSLSEAQIVKAAGSGVMPYDTALALLQAIGYPKGDAVVLLATAGVTATTPETPPPGGSIPTA